MATDISGLYNSTGGYYAIASAADLNALATYVNGDGTDDSAHDCAGLTFKVTANIDLKDVTFTPIGNYTSESINKPFSGTFDGDNHTISNLTINLADTNYVGLFGYNRGTIQNVKLSNVNVSG